MTLIKMLTGAAAAAAAMFVAVPAASAQPPNALTATVDCEGFDPVEVWIPNANAAFGQQAVGVTGLVIDASDVRVGVVFGDQNGSFRGNKPIDERGVETIECDATVPPIGTFEDVLVHVVP